jgi:hypothetical protein
MKKMVTLLVSASILLSVAVIAFGADSAAASSPAPKNAISFNVFGVLVNEYSGSYEFAITKQISAKVWVDFSPNWIWVTDIFLIGGGVEGRYYFGSLLGKSMPDWLTGDATKGLYAGAGAGFLRMSYSYTYTFDAADTYTYSLAYMAPEAVLEIGDKIVFGKGSGFYIEPFVGYQLAFGTWTESASGTGIYNGTIPTYSVPSTYNIGGVWYGANIGFAF